MADIGTMQMSYEGLVEAGREARQQADNMQWIEGDLALQVEALPGDERPRDPETGLFLEDEAKALKCYANDVGIAHRAIREYRRVAEAWPHEQRALHEVPWAVHQALAAQDDRFDLIQPGMTVRQAEKLVRDRNIGASGKPGWFELLGIVADTLTKADQQLTKAEEAIEDPNDDLRAKAREYADAAIDIAARLSRIAA